MAPQSLTQPHSMSTILILISIWYLIGLTTGIAATYLDWRDGTDVRLYHLPLVLISALIGPILTCILWGENWAESLHDIGDKVLARGRQKP